METLNFDIPTLHRILDGLEEEREELEEALDAAGDTVDAFAWVNPDTGLTEVPGDLEAAYVAAQDALLANLAAWEFYNGLLIEAERAATELQPPSPEPPEHLVPL